MASCRAWWRAATDTDGSRYATTTVADRSAGHITTSGSGWGTDCRYGAERGRLRNCGSSIVFHSAGFEILPQSEPQYICDTYGGYRQQRSLYLPGFRDNLRLPATDRGSGLFKVSLHSEPLPLSILTDSRISCGGNDGSSQCLGIHTATMLWLGCDCYDPPLYGDPGPSEQQILELLALQFQLDAQTFAPNTTTAVPHATSSAFLALSTTASSGSSRTCTIGCGSELPAVCYCKCSDGTQWRVTNTSPSCK